MSPTQFMWPVISKFYHFDEHDSLEKCWLCGELCGNDALPLREGISDTFCLPEMARCVNSELVCYPCSALSSKKTFDEYAAQRPEMCLKPGYASSWRNYSHVVFSDQHFCPSRAEWREWILYPPEPPFLFVIAVSSQKHLIYKSRISGSREQFWVQMEDDLINVKLSKFSDCLQAFENLYQSGFTKAEIETDSWNHKKIFQIGMNQWKEMTDALNFFRINYPLYIKLSSFVGQKSGESL